MRKWIVLILKGRPFQEEGKIRKIPEVGTCGQFLRKSEGVQVFEAQWESQEAEEMKVDM